MADDAKTFRMESSMVDLLSALRVAAEHADACIENNRGAAPSMVPGRGRALALVKTKIDEARLWLTEAMEEP